MTRLRDLVTLNYKKNLGTVGIEIETESSNGYSLPDFKYWRAEGDGSLRNFGVEFILSKPLDPGSREYAEAMVEFDKFAKTQKFLDSTYTSVHVHLNFADREARHLANFITLYLLFENVLTRYCGPDRDGNLFCLKTKDSEASYLLYRDLLKHIASGSTNYFLRSLNAARYKYSALNIVPLGTQGSVEVRTHPGATSSAPVDKWVKMLMCLYELAQKYNNPVEIMKETLNLTNYRDFSRKVFGHYHASFDQNKLDEDVSENLIYAKTLAYAVADWSTFGEVVHTVERFQNESLYLDELTAVAAFDRGVEEAIARIRTRAVQAPLPTRRGRPVVPTFTLTTDE